MIQVLVLLDYYLPGYKAGGPLRSISNMVGQLGDEFEFRIITSDRDLGDNLPYSDVLVDQWNKVGNSQVYYVSPNNLSMLRLARLINRTPHDVLYLNSFFHPVFTIWPLVARRLGLLDKRPTILAPRGEFSEGAIARKGWRKRVYIALAQFAGLYQNLIWQASSEYEKDDIYRNITNLRDHNINFKDGVVIAPDLPNPLRSSCTHEFPTARPSNLPLRVCFISRISPKKNLDYALRVLCSVKIPVLFDIYGPIEDLSYWHLCEELIDKMGPLVQVCYRGSVLHDAVPAVFASYDLFFFPTRGENFGHVILEAMMEGTPVLLSDTTPWRGLKALGVGWDLPLANPDEFVSAITDAASVEPMRLGEWRERVRNFALRTTMDESVVEKSRQLFSVTDMHKGT